MEGHQQREERGLDFPSSRQRQAVQEIAYNLADAAQLLRERIGGVSREPVTGNLSLLGRIQSMHSGRQSTVVPSNVASGSTSRLIASESRQCVKCSFPPPSMFARKRAKNTASSTKVTMYVRDIVCQKSTIVRG